DAGSPGGRRFFQVRGMRPGRPEAGARRGDPRGSRHDPTRRGGHRGGTTGTEARGVGPQRLWQRRLYVGGYHADRPAVVETGVPGPARHAGGRGNTASGLTRYGSGRRYNSGTVPENPDVTKFIRYRYSSGVAYGILDGDTIRELRGNLFHHAETGVERRL